MFTHGGLALGQKQFACVGAQPTCWGLSLKREGITDSFQIIVTKTQIFQFWNQPAGKIEMLNMVSEQSADGVGVNGMKVKYMMFVSALNASENKMAWWVDREVDKWMVVS